MKKILGSVFALLVLVSATGCFNSSKGKDIVCEKKEDETKYIYRGTVDGEKIVKIIAENTAIYEDEESAQKGYEFMEYVVNSYKPEVGMTFRTEKNGLETKIIATYELNKMNKEKIESSFGKSILTETDFKQFVTEDGYTCK